MMIKRHENIRYRLKQAIAYYNRYGMLKFLWERLLQDKIVSSIVGFYWNGKIRWTPRQLWMPFEKVRIHNPIFLVGTQGAGLTLLARMIKRHPCVVSVGGNNRFWTGRDELHNHPSFKYLPDEFVLRSPGFGNMTGKEAVHPIFGLERSWVYATDDLASQYRLTASDVNGQLKDALRIAIKKVIRAYATDPSAARFLDKSQSYSLKIPFLIEALNDTSPVFIVVIRNPYVMCWREAAYVGGKKRFFNRISGMHYLVALAAEHWFNTYDIALKDAGRYGIYMCVKYEDLVADPLGIVRTIFNYVGLIFDGDCVPQPSHKLPIGSGQRSKWYPISLERNQVYTQNIPHDCVHIIHDRCGELAKRFGYQMPQ